MADAAGGAAAWRCGMSTTWITVAVTRLEHTTDGHRKFYEVRVLWAQSAEEYVVRTSWGRIGTSGQSGERKFFVAKAAAKYAQETLEDKLAKGYVVAPAVAGIAYSDGRVYPTVSVYYDLVRRGVDPRLLEVAGTSARPTSVRGPTDLFGEADDQFFGRLRGEINRT